MKNITYYIKENIKKSKKKETSAGVIIVCPSGFLICHPTGKSFKNKNWDIPKGHIEHHENNITAALREVYEETGLILTKESLKYIGEFDYTINKNLHIFITFLNNDINIKSLKCISSFINNKGQSLLEMDYYMLTNDIDMLYPSLKKIFQQISLKSADYI